MSHKVPKLFIAGSIQNMQPVQLQPCPALEIFRLLICSICLDPWDLAALRVVGLMQPRVLHFLGLASIIKPGPPRWLGLATIIRGWHIQRYNYITNEMDSHSYIREIVENIDEICNLIYDQPEPGYFMDLRSYLHCLKACFQIDRPYPSAREICNLLTKSIQFQFSMADIGRTTRCQWENMAQLTRGRRLQYVRRLQSLELLCISDTYICTLWFLAIEYMENLRYFPFNRLQSVVQS